MTCAISWFLFWTVVKIAASLGSVIVVLLACPKNFENPLESWRTISDHFKNDKVWLLAKYEGIRSDSRILHVLSADRKEVYFRDRLSWSSVAFKHNGGIWLQLYWKWNKKRWDISRYLFIVKLRKTEEGPAKRSPSS